MGTHEKTVLIIGTLDTKGEECLYIRDLVQERGHKGLLIDPGALGRPAADGDISRQAVAEKAGADLEALVRTRDKGKIIQTMTEGLTAWVEELFKNGNLDGVIAVGGGQGTAMGTAAMQVLPIGFPKVMVSTIASGNMRPFIQTSDIAVFPSVTDVFGVNSIFVRILENAVNALLGMVEHYHPLRKSHKVVIGATAFGVVTPGLMKMKQIFNENELEMVLFHATGIGGRAMEELALSGYFDGIMDWTTHEIVDAVGQGIFSPGKTRMDYLSRMSIPCVIAPGAIDYICKGPFEGLSRIWKKRNHIIHNRNITLVRATAGEMTRAATFLIRKVNKAIGPVKILIPLRGFSEPNAEGKPFYDPETDRLFIRALKEGLREGIDVVEIDAHINDDTFIREATRLMMAMLNPNRLS